MSRSLERHDVALVVNTVQTVLTPPSGHKFEIVGWSIYNDPTLVQYAGSAINFGGTPGTVLFEGPTTAGLFAYQHNELSAVIYAGEHFQLFLFGGAAGPFGTSIWYVDVDYTT